MPARIKPNDKPPLDSNKGACTTPNSNTQHSTANNDADSTVVSVIPVVKEVKEVPISTDSRSNDSRSNDSRSNDSRSNDSHLDDSEGHNKPNTTPTTPPSKVASSQIIALPQLITPNINTTHQLDNIDPTCQPQVQNARQTLIRSVAYLSQAEQQDIIDACAFATYAHIKQKRKSGEPYVTHPIAVADILAGFHLDRDTIIAAILHDTVEDTDITSQQVSQRYGYHVARLVDGVTKLKSSRHNKAQNKAATFHKIMSATLNDSRVLIIKLADRLHNMSTLDAVSSDKQKSTANETLKFYVPFARLMGLNDIADYIEILCYRNIDPVMYTKLSDKLLQHGLGRRYQKDAVHGYLNHVLDKLELAGNVRVLDNQVIMYRQFFRNRGEIHDLLRHYAFEVVTHSVEDCDLLAQYLIKRYQIPPELVEDNIRHPLPGGNQSLTLTYVNDNDTIKVTILTQKMQESARLGVIGADSASEVSRSVIKASLRNMKELVALDEQETPDQDCLENDDDPDYSHVVESIDELISYLNARKILCYSPKGRAYELPRNATALDFAYAVGPKVGHIAVGAKIDGVESKLGSILKTGQTVEIEVDKHSKPKAEWLGIVVTTKARRQLRHWFSDLPKQEQQEHGKQALDRALRTYGKTLADVTLEDWNDLLEWQNTDSRADIFENMCSGTLLPQLVVSRLFSDDVTKLHAKARAKGFYQPNDLLSNANGVEVHFAGCCNPIFGDNIIGHLTMNGLILHRHLCYSIVKKYETKPYELVQLDWHSEADIEASLGSSSERPHFTAYLEIPLALDDEQVSHVIYTLRQLNIGVEKVDIHTQDTVIHVIVRSRSHLQQGIDALRPEVGFGSIRRLYHL